MIRRIILLGSLIAAAGCGDKKPTEPTGGDFTVAYTGPSQTDGALLLVVTGPVASVSGLGSYQVAFASTATGLTKVVVTGAVTPGDLFRITVKDISVAHTAVIEAAADRATFALGDPASYSATVRK